MGGMTVQAEEPAELPTVRQNCLVVDDSRVIRKISRSIVERLGYEVIEAEHGAEALERCKAEMPDLVLLDWDMPQMSGIEFVAALRALDGGDAPKVVFCTSKGDDVAVHKAFEAGANEYVVKPFDQVSLLAKLQRIGAA
ncbi:MAG TPA: response regulator [Sphingomonadaceae bacterium]|nr:response regulator [Sphingomonadaceae bacterium]